MQKKLMAVAVAGVLAAPAIALAQSSTVQVFGTFYVEYSYIDQGRVGIAPAGGDRQNIDLLQTPGSEIGFKGEEKLGGGLSAWFQCATTADVRGQSQDGLCGRNSALGLKGGFGNVFIGVWDTPFKRLAGPTNVGGNDTGVFGTAQLLFAGSTTLFGRTSRANFKRRQQNSISYDSPNFGGFQAMAMYSSTNDSTQLTAGATNGKARVLSFGGQYSAGPIYVSAAYELHKQFGGVNGPNAVNAGFDNGGGNPAGAGAIGDQDDKGWHAGAAYTWGPVRFGGQYTQQRLDSFIGAGFPGAGAASNLKVKAWHVGVDWNIVGPHGLRAAYTQADDMKGTLGTVAVAGSQSQTRPGVPVSNNTGAKMYQIRYVYTMSKRTEFTFGYVKLDNDGNPVSGGAGYNLFGVGGGTAATPGNNQDAWAMGLRHTF